ncbi:hypothetical protein GWI33_014913 [Rhynchophorus ferrugineus]|uniref:Uncharacterized protein n=1 Tax=Rhynchophorus ferrugineus TaxID=354439 RepID=A0A834I498_RHYFE|nr:hypothetical protein GWI33_014913 [Rhynchophorus ferrugineus]
MNGESGERETGDGSSGVRGAVEDEEKKANGTDAGNCTRFHFARKKSGFSMATKTFLFAKMPGFRLKELLLFCGGVLGELSLC